MKNSWRSVSSDFIVHRESLKSLVVEHLVEKQGKNNVNVHLSEISESETLDYVCFCFFVIRLPLFYWRWRLND